MPNWIKVPSFSRRRRDFLRPEDHYTPNLTFTQPTVLPAAQFARNRDALFALSVVHEEETPPAGDLLSLGSGGASPNHFVSYQSGSTPELVIFWGDFTTNCTLTLNTNLFPKQGRLPYRLTYALLLDHPHWGVIAWVNGRIMGRAARVGPPGDEWADNTDGGYADVLRMHSLSDLHYYDRRAALFGSPI